MGTKAELTAEKEGAAATLSDKKAAFEAASGDYNAQKAGVHWLGVCQRRWQGRRPRHHGRHCQVGQGRNRLAQRQEGDARCHRKRPENALDSQPFGHFAGLNTLRGGFDSPELKTLKQPEEKKEQRKKQKSEHHSPRTRTYHRKKKKKKDPAEQYFHPREKKQQQIPNAWAGRVIFLRVPFFPTLSGNTVSLTFHFSKNNNTVV